MSVAARWLVEAIRWRIRAQRRSIPKIPTRVEAWLAFRRGRSAYRVLDEAALRATRKSDTVFLFGSGYSLNAISPPEWRAIEAHDTIGFNWFVRESFVRCDYHFIREIAYNDAENTGQNEVAIYCDLIRRNPHYAHTVLMVQTGFRATNGNRVIGWRLLPRVNSIFLWRTRPHQLRPSRSIQEGLAHGRGTLCECVNFAALLGWRNIVLVGVDLYDRRYFWLGENEPLACDPTVDEPHKTAQIVAGLGEWRDTFAPEGVRLYAYNPRSLLVPTLPVWRWN